jgi:hypothetical protein
MHSFKLTFLATALCAASAAIASPGTLLNGALTPGPTNTGPTDPGILTPSGSLVVTTPGAVIQNLAINGSIEIDAPDVTVENCTITAPDIVIGQSGGASSIVDVDAGADNFTLENTSITGGAPGTVGVFSSANNAQFTNLNMYDLPTSPFQLSGSSTVSGCWLHAIGWNALGLTSNPTKTNFNGIDHVDDIFFEKGAYLNVIGNNFDTPANTTINGVNYSVSNVDIFTIPYATGDVVGPVTVQDNYLDGGGYTFSLCGQGATSVTDNIIGADEAYGVVNENYIGGPLTWDGNVDPNGSAVDVDAPAYAAVSADDLTTTSVPEPASASLIVIGGIGFLSRRRRA